MAEQALLIGEVAAQAGVNVQTLRYYERRGLVRPARRSTNNRRQYSIESVRLVRFIKRAQELGFSLEEIGQLIYLRAARGRRRAKVRNLAAEKLATVHEKLDRLRAMEGALKQLVEACACSEDQLVCPILEALDDDPAGRLPTRFNHLK